MSEGVRCAWYVRSTIAALVLKLTSVSFHFSHFLLSAIGIFRQNYLPTPVAPMYTHFYYRKLKTYISFFVNSLLYVSYSISLSSRSRRIGMQWWWIRLQSNDNNNQIESELVCSKLRRKQQLIFSHVSSEKHEDVDFWGILFTYC